MVPGTLAIVLCSFLLSGDPDAPSPHLRWSLAVDPFDSEEVDEWAAVRDLPLDSVLLLPAPFLQDAQDPFPRFQDPAELQEKPPTLIEPPERRASRGILLDAGDAIWTGGKILGRDLAYLATAPLRPSLKGLGYFFGGTALVGGVMLLDEKIHDFTEGLGTPTVLRASQYLSDAFEPQYAVGFGVGLTVASFVFDDEHLRRTSLEVLEATSITALMVQGLKNVAGRSRPRADRGSRDWDFFGGTGGSRGSFPSGHTAGAFGIATVIGEEYPGTVWEYGAYSLAALVGLSRMELDAHWASDVVAGFLLSQVVGRTLVWLHRQEDFPTLVPWLSTGDGETVAGVSLQSGF